MFELTHALTGIAIAQQIRNSDGQKLPFNSFPIIFAGLSGLLPDIVEFIIPSLPHGSWSHTILFGTIISLIYSLLVLFVGKELFSQLKLKLSKIIVLGWLATMSHLFLDIFTHQNFECQKATENMLHIYFWPLWDQSFHLDCLFGWSYTVRVILEWVVYFPLIIFYFLNRWRKYNQNPFSILNLKYWFQKVPPSNTKEIKGDEIHSDYEINMKKYKKIFLILCIYGLPIIYGILAII